MSQRPSQSTTTNSLKSISAICQTASLIYKFTSSDGTKTRSAENYIGNNNDRRRRLWTRSNASRQMYFCYPFSHMRRISIARYQFIFHIHSRVNIRSCHTFASRNSRLPYCALEHITSLAGRISWTTSILLGSWDNLSKPDTWKWFLHTNGQSDSAISKGRILCVDITWLIRRIYGDSARPADPNSEKPSAS